MNKNCILKLKNTRPLRDSYGSIFELAGIQTGLPLLGLAWVEVDAHATSPAAYHKVTSEIYYVVEGAGVMILDGEEHEIEPGDCISILPGVVHCVRNSSNTALRLLVATSPSYDPEDDIEVERNP